MSTAKQHGSTARLVVLLTGAAILFGWGLSISGYANAYYSAAAQAGAQSWKAFFFGSVDAGNAITVDKPPLGLWPIALSVRAFGLSPWSLLLPQAAAGVATVGLLYGCVRRATDHTLPALVAGAALVVTPVAVLVFRYNNPDALLTLLLVGAAYCVLRAVSSTKPAWWLATAGLLCGFGFLTKMLEAFVVMPALALTYLVYAEPAVLVRVRNLLLAGCTVLIGAGWWVATVELWPAADRPYIGGSSTNSVLQLAIGYNGVGRITGSAGTTATSTGLGATNVARIGRLDLGGEILWLVPAAILLGILAWRLSAQRRLVRASIVLWSTWLALTSVTFALMAGIFHSYYTVITAPAICALVGTGCWLGWEHRHSYEVRRWLVATFCSTALLAAVTLTGFGHHLWWSGVLLAVAGIVMVLFVGRRSFAGIGRPQPAVAALLVALAGPAVFSLATASSAHVGSGPMAGPGMGVPTTRFVASPPVIGGLELPTSDRFVPRAVVDLVGSAPGRYRWTAATLGARSASAYELALGQPVVAIGGYKGTDPFPSLTTFAGWVRDHQLHYFIDSGTGGAAADTIRTWVTTRFDAHFVGGYAVYDLS